MPRPPLLPLDAIVALRSDRAEHRIQAASDRRAVLMAVIDHGGRCRITDLNAHFNFDTRSIVNHLVRRGWLMVVQGEPA